ncbi:fimbrial protein [Pseudomonas syringae]|uniref:fimbrial protein n=1 Tax=Pseudomonas syringae TaxID=317 RepID=UPI000C1CB3A5|nr:fimbrial protein [Pseudomonas syringae]MCF8984772.1 fimbrial protein [Pseudomonas syringae]MCF9004320.1 fimbrial protein [Pseudomonas syringae]PIO93797.1 fimbrial protein [Pseudomonas syringae]POP72055.1 type 1 fimbrial protein [Pseudomonas syringae]POP81148.1 type 1 fimbrial protein [Pseudomonas syringae]
MNTALNALLPSLILLGASYSAAAYSDVPDDTPSNDCYWVSPPGLKDYRRDIGTLYVPRDARVGTVIGSIDVLEGTPDQAGLEAACRNDGTALLEFNATATAPIFPGNVDPINGEDLTGKILQTNIPGVGVRIRLGHPYDSNCPNCFMPAGGSATVPFIGLNDHRDMLTSIRLLHMNNYLTLVKTGPIPSGPNVLNGSELFSGSVTTLGRIMRFGLTGTVLQAQCSVGADPVSADPVQLGEWDSADFTGPGFTTPAVPFSIALSNCETDTGSGFVATAHIQLDGVEGSVPEGPANSGVFSLTSDSDAKGMGIQVLKGDGVTPMELQTEVPLIAITPGNVVLNFYARFYQTQASSAIRPGKAKGALSFTMTYK